MNRRMKWRVKWSLVVVAALVAAFVVAFVVGAAGCKRPCQSAQNCKRSCECVNGQNNTRIDCAMAFRCEGETQVCEDDYDSLSCDALCSQYAARGLCGLERCLSNDDCAKNLSCPGINADGTPNPAVQQACSLTFVCDVDQQVCDPRSTAPEEQLCAVECVAAAGG